MDVSYFWSPFNDMTGNTGLVGMFYDGWDSKVKIAGTLIEIEVTAIKFEVWAVDKANLTLDFANLGPAYDSNAGIRSAQDRYEGWVGAGDATKVKLLSGVSTYYRFAGTETGAGPFVFDGQTESYWDVNENDATGLWNASVGGNQFFTDPAGNKADVKLTFDIEASEDGWTVNSHDDGGFLFAVPEPLTLVGLVVSAAGVGNYLRRRRLAKA